MFSTRNAERIKRDKFNLFTYLLGDLRGAHKEYLVINDQILKDSLSKENGLLERLNMDIYELVRHPFNTDDNVRYYPQIRQDTLDNDTIDRLFDIMRDNMDDREIRMSYDHYIDEWRDIKRSIAEEDERNNTPPAPPVPPPLPSPPPSPPPPPTPPARSSVIPSALRTCRPSDPGCTVSGGKKRKSLKKKKRRNTKKK